MLKNIQVPSISQHLPGDSIHDLQSTTFFILMLITMVARDQRILIKAQKLRVGSLTVVIVMQTVQQIFAA